MNELNIAQQEICKLLETILNSKDYKDNHNKAGLKEILKTIVKHYPEVDSQFRKAWRNINLYKENHRISERAAKLIDNDEDWKKLHYEHIQPVSYTINQLIQLQNPTLENIKKIMDETEVIILSKEEAKILDGSQNAFYPLDENKNKGLGMKYKVSKENRLEALESIGFKFHKDYIQNKLK